MVASRSTMTGTHECRFEIGPFQDIPATGRRVEVRHMHFFRWVDGKNTDLWHVWDTPALMRQLGGAPYREGASA
jgi:predicted ester cyclase